MQYTIVDDNVEVAPMYRCDGKEPQPTQPESQCKQQLKSFVVPVQGSLDK